MTAKLTPLVQNLMTACFRITSDNGQDPAEKARKELVDAIAALERSLAAAEARNAELQTKLEIAEADRDQWKRAAFKERTGDAALTEQRGEKP